MRSITHYTPDEIVYASNANIRIVDATQRVIEEDIKDEETRTTSLYVYTGN